MERLLSRLILRLATRPSRRRVPVRGRGEADLRRSFRRAVAHGGEVLSPARRAPPLREPPLGVVFGTSGPLGPPPPLPPPLAPAPRPGARPERTGAVFCL